jgi:hypothetical protein
MDVTMVFALGVIVLRFGLLVAGVLFCWFGYRLFAQTSSHGSAEFSLKETIKINFQHVGPGVFFSLFGTAILVYGILNPPVLDQRTVESYSKMSGEANAGAATSSDSSVTIAGLKTDGQILNDRARVLQVQQQIGFINRIDDAGKVHADDQVDLSRHTRDIKLALMQSIWSESWGDRVAFEKWTRDTASGTPNEDARQLFLRK